MTCEHEIVSIGYRRPFVYFNFTNVAAYDAMAVQSFPADIGHLTQLYVEPATITRHCKVFDELRLIMCYLRVNGSILINSFTHFYY